MRDRMGGEASAGKCAGEGTSSGTSGVSEKKKAISGRRNVLDGEKEGSGG